MAEKSASMAIFLGKQYLGQRDNVDVTVAGEKNNLLEAIAKTGEIDTDDLPEVE